MKLPARRSPLALLFSLLVLSGLIIFGGKAAETLRASRSENKNDSVKTVTSAAALARDGSVAADDPDKMALEPAQTGGSFDIARAVVAGGGGASASGNTALAGTAGQSSANVSAGGQFSLSGGFWVGEACPAITLAPTTLPSGTLGVPYGQTISASGGATPYNFTVTDGALPNDLTLSAAGLLSGTPVQSGSFNFTVKATDANGCTNTLAYALVIGSCPGITITPATLSNGTAGTAYTQTFTANGGTPPYNFGVTAGALPGGVSLSASGGLSGTPTASGPFNFTVTATDSIGCTGESAYTLMINPACGAITINPMTLANGFVGTAYNQTFSATGGSAPYSFAVSLGSLPAGLNLTTSGGLTGTPMTAGTFTFTVQAMDSGGCTGGRAYTIIISGDGLMFYPLAHPVRLLETRAGFTGCDSPAVPIAGGTSRTQTIAGRTCDGLLIPASARAVTGNITTVQSGGGYLTLYPSDAAQPLVANSNYNPNEILNNVFTVGLGAGDGAFKIFVTSDTHVVVDVTGYYAPPGANGLFFHPLPHPVRLLETRAGFTGCFAPGAPLPGNVDSTQPARGLCDGLTIPATASAVVGNATTVNPQGPGFPYLTLFPADATRPVVASSNYQPGQIMNAPFTVGLSPAGAFKIYPTTQTELVIDVLGYYSPEVTDVNGAGLLFSPLPRPVRLLETRAGFTGCSAPGAPLLVGSTRTQLARGLCDGVTIANTALGIIGNATVVVPQNDGYLTFWPSDAVQPLVATSNFTAGQVFNRHFTVGLGNFDGAFKVFTSATTELVIDVSGYFAP